MSRVHRISWTRTASGHPTIWTKGKAMLLYYTLNWGIRAVSLFNTIILLWLGLTLLLNAERRRWGTWVASGGLLTGGAFFAAHSAVAGRVFETLDFQVSFWWRLIWLPFIF